jgi:predicted histone-like DNA-binding protein
MSVKFNVVGRPNPIDRAAPKKFYPSIISSGRKNLHQISERAAGISTLRAPDLASVAETLLTVISLELAEGNKVELGDFGTFWLRTFTEGAETAEEVNAGQIVEVLPRFTPGKRFKKLLGQIEFEKVKGAPVQEEEPEESPAP